MIKKGNNINDPRGLIFESYRIDGIHLEECRSIFFDWALGLPLGTDVAAALRDLLQHYGDKHPDHPMTSVLTEGLGKAVEPKRRGGRAARANR